jgi:hypothetical protein
MFQSAFSMATKQKPTEWDILELVPYSDSDEYLSEDKDISPWSDK